MTDDNENQRRRSHRLRRRRRRLGTANITCSYLCLSAATAAAAIISGGTDTMLRTASASAPTTRTTTTTIDDQADPYRHLIANHHDYPHRHPVDVDEDRPYNYNDSQDHQRQLNPHHKSGIYKFLDQNDSMPYTTIGDVWLCLAFAIGWTTWWIGCKQSQLPSTSIYESQESRKVMGNVLQVSLGEDNLGTGIPVYHAVIDYVIEGDDVDVEPIQVRKIFCTKKMLEEGFANVEVLVLYDDPTTAILVEDYIQQKKEDETEDPPSIPMTILTYSIAALLIAASIFGAVLVIFRLPSNQRVVGWISLVVGVVLLYPVANMLYKSISYLYRLAGPLSDRPGVIIHGQRLTCTNQCHANLDPREVFNDINTCITPRRKTGSSSSSGGAGNRQRTNNDFSGLELPSMDDSSNASNHIEPRKVATPKHLLYPNAGCGLGEYRVHMPRMGSSCSGRPRTGSSVSSISASGGHSNRERGRSLNLPILVKFNQDDFQTS